MKEEKDEKAILEGVAVYFAKKSIEENKQALTIMQILKLVYIVQGYHLAIENSPFFKQETYAWKYGPVIKDLYYSLKDWLSQNDIYLNEKFLPHSSYESFNDKQKSILSVVFKKYGKLSAMGLSRLTHKDGTPWAERYKKEEEGLLIEKELIKKYYKTIVTPNSLAILLDQI